MMSLLVAPVFDDVTQYSAVWADGVKQILPNPTVIKDRPVTRSEVEAACVDKDLLCFYNHGNESGLFGNTNEQVVSNENIDKLPKVIYTMACLSAKECGVNIWRSGRTFWGYYDVFSFTTDALPEFEQMANYGIILVIEGKTWGEAYTATIEFGTSLSKLLADAGNYIASVAMESNVKALRLYDETHAPTETSCFFRKVALLIFGGKGWNLKRFGKRKEMKT